MSSTGAMMPAAIAAIMLLIFVGASGPIIRWRPRPRGFRTRPVLQERAWQSNVYRPAPLGELITRRPWARRADGELVDLVEAPSGHVDDVVMPETVGRRPQPVEVDEPGKTFGHRGCGRDDLTAAHRVPDHPDRRARRRCQHPGELAEIERARAPHHPRRQPPRITVATHIDRPYAKPELHQSRSEVVPRAAVVVGAMNQHHRWGRRIAPAPCPQARPIHLDEHCPIGRRELVAHDRSSSQASSHSAQRVWTNHRSTPTALRSVDLRPGPPAVTRGV